MKKTIVVNKRIKGPWDNETSRVMAKLRKQMSRLRSLERKQARIQKQIDREAYEWSALDQ